VTFANIPGNYRTLFITASARTSRPAQESDIIGLQFNGDGGNNYDWIVEVSTCGGATGLLCARASTRINIAIVEAANSTANTFSTFKIEIVGYALADRYTRAYCPSSGVFGNVSADTDLSLASYRGQWRNRAAVVSATLGSVTGNNLVTGCMFTLYGVL
jgi:hypothetical protein